MEAYTALHFIDRGKNADPSVVKPGEVFEFRGTERDHLLDNSAIRRRPLTKSCLPRAVAASTPATRHRNATMRQTPQQQSGRS